MSLAFFTAGCPSAANTTALSRDSVAAVLPADTEAWIAVANPEAAAEVMARDTFLEGSTDYAEFHKEIERELGVDPLDPASITKAGLNARKPLGFVLISAEQEVGAAYAHISDLPAFFDDAGPLRQEAAGQTHQ